jgi:hypothetical protein
MGNYSNEPDLKIYNLKILDLFISVCEFLISAREHRCELSFYKTKMEDFAPRNYDELEDDFLKNEVPIVWPWEDPFKYWRKKGGKKTYRKKNTLKKRKTNKNKNKNKK